MSIGIDGGLKKVVIIRLRENKSVLPSGASSLSRFIYEFEISFKIKFRSVSGVVASVEMIKRASLGSSDKEGKYPICSY